MKSYILDWKKYSDLARTACSEGCVLLRNEQSALPIRPGETAAVFGRIQLDYYKSGTGSGGMVNVPYVRSILDGLEEHSEISIYEPLLNAYRVWVKGHPFDRGKGWGEEPWSQEEMSLTDELVSDAAAHADLALIIIGRTAGEDRDNSGEEGSYYLTAGEKKMLEKVCGAFRRTAVVLNVGNIIDMSWVEEFSPSAVLYVWQGGMEGGCGAADVLCGTVSPSGKLPDTIARTLDDYPAVHNFGSKTVNLYQEDIYVGYRYFETFARSRVLYPFGYGMSYTTFSVSTTLEDQENELLVSASVRNTGSCAGKEVVQVYVQPPQGLLGKPVRNLCAFAKTECLAPGEEQKITLKISKSELASYDDSGVTGYRSCFVLEQGCYRIYAGTDVRSAALTGSFSVAETTVVSRHSEALAPVTPFKRIRPAAASAISSNTADTGERSAPGTRSVSAYSTPADNDELTLTYEPAPLRTIDPADRRLEHLPDCPAYTGDRGYRLCDVADGLDMNDFLAQLSDEDLMHIVNGEGMCSPKVTPGTAAAFGGLTESLQHFGIPAGCCSDGPSGIRMDSGANAFSLPNGTLLASTFNTGLVTKLFEMEGLELYANQIDSLLGPGINIHRCPLNGRNFEYHSEDPYLTGRMAAAQLEGMARFGISGTIKHFCANNQEYNRHNADSVVSERALREIYLKPFEMSVRSGFAHSVMTSYGPVNGIWTAGNYDLNTTLLRGEWGYKGIVMSDWWAKANEEGCDADISNRASMVRAQNDLFMVTSDTTADKNNLKDALEHHTLTRAELVRSAGNICAFLLASPAHQRLMGTYTAVTHTNQPQDLLLSEEGSTDRHSISADTEILLDTYMEHAVNSFQLTTEFEQDGVYRFLLSASAPGVELELAQLPVTLSIDGTLLHTYAFHGGMKETMTIASGDKMVRGRIHYLKLYFPIAGIKLHSLRIVASRD